MNKNKKTPILSLLALTVSGFIAIITETLPAGLLPQISKSIGISESYAGQLITSYALGSVLSAIPVISYTRNWNRKPLLLTAIAGFCVFNLATYLFQSFLPLLLIVRFAAGVCAGIIWGLLTGYTIRMVRPELAGKALAIVGVGQPIALSLGVPLAVWLSTAIGWATIFLIIAALSLIVFFWIVFLVPDFPAKQKTHIIPFKAVFSNKKIKTILFTTLFWILGHNLMYTYIAPYLDAKKLAGHIDLILLLFGVFSILGIWVTGLFVDKKLHKLIVINLFLFLVAAVLLWVGNSNFIVILIAIAAWGYSFGGAPILLQKDLADIAQENVDIAQSIFVTVFNLAVAGGGLLGGILLEYLGIHYIVIALVILILAAFITARKSITTVS